MKLVDLRKELGLSVRGMATKLGLSSPGHVSQIERGLAVPSVRVALMYESLSDKRIDAASLNSEVASARGAEGG